MLADLFHHGRSVGFFTTVAATCVLGSQALVVGEFFEVAVVLWFVGIALWVVLTYAIFTILTVQSEKPTLAEGIHGGWLVSVVAAHSIAVLGAQLAPGLTPYAPQALLFSLVMWLGGAMLYLRATTFGELSMAQLGGEVDSAASLFVAGRALRAARDSGPARRAAPRPPGSDGFHRSHTRA